MTNFCVHEKHGGVCKKTGTYCNLGACVYEDLKEFEVVRHGKWERTDITEESGWALYRCSCCNWHTTYYYSFSASPTYNFCPNCGAKMGVNDYEI